MNYRRLADLDGQSSKKERVDLESSDFMQLRKMIEAETIFLQNAKRKGAKTLNGLGWLIHQGAFAWKLWTGVDMPIDVVRNTLLAELTKN